MHEDDPRHPRTQAIFIPPWWQKRLPFTINVSLMIGSTMFDFCLWKLPEVLSIGIFWVHLDIQIDGRR